MAEPKSTLSTLPASALKPGGASFDPNEISAADEKYNAAMQRILNALDARENKGYDPTLMAIAQGMLTPGQTGSFFEGVGKAVSNVQQQQKESQKEELDNAQLRLQLAQAERAQANRLKALQMGFGGSGGAPTAPAGGAAPTQGGQQSQTITVGGQQFPASFTRITPETAAIAKIHDPEIGKLYDEYIKLRNEGFKVQPGGYVDVNAPGGPKYTPFGGKAMVERNVSGIGVVKMPEEDALSLDEARRSNDLEKYWKIVDANTKPVPKPSEKPSGAAEPTIRKEPSSADSRTTEASLAAQAAADKERATVLAKSEAERTNLVNDAAKAARGAQAGYTRANEILADKEVQKNLGVLNRGDFTSALGNLVSEAFRVGNYSVGIPAIKEILQKSGLPQDTINKLAELGQIEAMWQMESRKGLGAGTSVSNMEQMMANRITPSQDDPYGAYKQKLAFLQEKSKFDIALARELKRSKMTYDDFEDTDAFDRIFNDYQKRLMDITTGSSKASGSKSTTQTGPITAESLRNRLNLPR